MMNPASSINCTKNREKFLIKFLKEHSLENIKKVISYLPKEERDICGRKYIAAERVIREREHFDLVSEVKATTISNTNKGKLYRSINQIEKFGVVINEKKVLDSIFSVKKSKQRYLDFAYKISVKRKFEDLIKRGIIIPNQVEGIYFL